MMKALVPTMFLLFLSCSLFDPRTPADPSQGGVVWQTPTSPDIVVENMVSALNGASVLYLDCLDDSFLFYADTSDIDDYPTLNFSDWTKSVENLTVGQIYSSVPSDTTIQAEFLLVAGNPDPPAPEDSVTIYRQYTIILPGAQHSPAFGIAELHMVEDEDGLWSVGEWYDNRFDQSTPYKTWAVAKAVYR
ncbi:MAG TPA: hypothetical protein P5207_08610 [Candidatus Sabulitectum sp.]|nr:hypothetical protein [Candidatus Sabulitectum sp.]